MNIEELREKKDEFYVVRGCMDYADEFDVDFIDVYTSKRLLDVLEYIHRNNEYLKRCEYYFGTNEFLNTLSFKHLMGHLEITPVSKEDYDVLSRYSISTGHNFLEGFKESIGYDFDMA